jgi:hypothetical protein
MADKVMKGAFEKIGLVKDIVCYFLKTSDSSSTSAQSIDETAQMVTKIHSFVTGLSKDNYHKAIVKLRKCRSVPKTYDGSLDVEDAVIDIFCYKISLCLGFTAPLTA